MTVTPESRIGEIASQFPLATRVFARHRIDFCCGGGVSLADACARRGLDHDVVRTEIERELAAADPAHEETNWEGKPSSELVRHIVERFHAPLREELPRLESMARKVVRVHGERDPERLGELLESFLRLEAELEEHLRDEEERLFPAIVNGANGSPLPVATLADDHARVGSELERIRTLTDDYRAPEGACNTWNALWHGLAALERDLHEHIHLENNVLFPRLSA